MTSYNAPPRAMESGHIQCFVQLNAQLLNIHSRARFEQSINQHAVLQRKQRIRIFDLDCSVLRIVCYIQSPDLVVGWSTRAFSSAFSFVSGSFITALAILNAAAALGNPQ